MIAKFVSKSLIVAAVVLTLGFAPTADARIKLGCFKDGSHLYCCYKDDNGTITCPEIWNA